jgi:hypothetical protein
MPGYFSAGLWLLQLLAASQRHRTSSARVHSALPTEAEAARSRTL